MKQQELAALFARTADLLEFRGDNPFRIRAYRRAAQSLDRFGGDLEEAARSGSLRRIPGIGQDLAAKITEFCATGRVIALERLQATVPRGVLELLDVPGLGPKTAKVLHERLRVSTLAGLERALREHRLRGLPGFQARKEANLLKGLAVLRRGRARMHLGIAAPLADELIAFLRRIPGVAQASAAGSLRRMRETIGDLDLLAASASPAKVIEAFVAAPFCRRALAAGTTKASVLTSGDLQVDLRVVAPQSYGAALQYFTGSKEHNVRLRELASRRGLKVNEYGVFRAGRPNPLAGREEADVYRALGLPWIPPEIREDQGELEAAQRGRLPSLVERGDIRGDFHVHTTWSDGSDGLEAMARAARSRGYAYVAICDHSPSLRVAHGLSVARLKQQWVAIRALNRRLKGLRVLMGAEVDILPDGSMDHPDEVLRQLDFVVGSVHSAFSQERGTMTRRLVGAMSHPFVTLIGHPTGRLMGQRDAYDVDLEAVYRAAKETGTALELNASPQRLDLCDTAARRAKDLGVMLAISTDAHSQAQLDQMRFGLGQARRAWCEPRHLLNCLPLDRLLAWVARKRSGGAGRPRRG